MSNKKLLPDDEVRITWVLDEQRPVSAVVASMVGIRCGIPSSGVPTGFVQWPSPSLQTAACRSDTWRARASSSTTRSRSTSSRTDSGVRMAW